MLSQMVSQVFLPSEALLAELAPMRRISGMDANVIIQMLFPRESLGAKMTPMRGLSRVLSHVIREVLLPRERFRAVLAFVGRFTWNKTNPPLEKLVK